MNCSMSIRMPPLLTMNEALGRLFFFFNGPENVTSPWRRH